MIPPGSTIGILGGGQLGRMTALAAARLGYRSIIYSPEANPIAGQVAAGQVRGAYDDKAALARFAAQVDVITYEFENVPEQTVAECERHRPVRPGIRPIHFAQHRLREKAFFREAGIGTADLSADLRARPTSPPRRPARHPEDLHRRLMTARARPGSRPGTD